MAVAGKLPSKDSLVTVIMPVFNGDRFIEEAIEGVLNQTHENFRFMIVDDGSGDRSAELSKRDAARDGRIELNQHENRGVAVSMNRVLELARTDWVFRMDSDDIMLPQRLERQIAFIQENPQMKGASFKANYIDTSGRIFGTSANTIRTPKALKDLVDRGEAIGLLGPGAAMDRQTILSVGGFRGQFLSASDIDLWTRTAENGHLVLVQDEILMKYRIHNKSIVTSDFLANREQYEWVRQCMYHRRTGKTEPNWQEFQTIWNSAPWWKKK